MHENDPNRALTWAMVRGIDSVGFFDVKVDPEEVPESGKASFVRHSPRIYWVSLFCDPAPALHVVPSSGAPGLMAHELLRFFRANPVVNTALASNVNRFSSSSSTFPSFFSGSCLLISSYAVSVRPFFFIFRSSCIPMQAPLSTENEPNWNGRASCKRRPAGRPGEKPGGHWLRYRPTAGHKQ